MGMMVMIFFTMEWGTMKYSARCLMHGEGSLNKARTDREVYTKDGVQVSSHHV